jgi:hypothetical protein
MRPADSRGKRSRAVVVALVAAAVSIGWSDTTTRWAAWSAVEFFPPDLARHVRKNHRRFEAGLSRGLQAPPSWRAGPPGKLREALEAQAIHCAEALLEPVPLDDLVEELGVLAVLALDANDPLAVSHGDPREPQYAAEYWRYVDDIRGRVRLVYYGRDPRLAGDGPAATVHAAITRSDALYPYIGDEFFRTGSLRSWRTFDDRSVAFGVAAVSLSRGLTDVANLAQYVWMRGGGRLPPPRPTPSGHVGPTVTLVPELEGGFPGRDRPGGAPALPRSELVLPPP